ncbi:DUF2239 family protein [Bradyrhizobium sp.]|uniref:DUF2239 family protein n=1 Tax=Bradyrhizobium sp. TaxID=376 RepID=UPI0027202C2B|nr:DUF2239 family protein [Bradyrhizobium sp.]MDO9296588.1 DUF2239 family protein [Bradyrhizobium sp.]
MNPESDPACVAFEGDRRIASGDLRAVVRAAKATLDRARDASIIVFDGNTSATIEIDFRGSMADVLARLPDDARAQIPAEAAAASAPRGPGRPKLGVVAREVTLLPRHWEWLARQPGGASVAIRKLVEQASRTGEDKDRIRQAQEAAYRFMSVTSGNRPHYEEAIRALFAGDAIRFEQRIAEWPDDIRAHTSGLAERAFRLAAQPGASG